MPIIKRDIFNSIQKHLNHKEITLITGARQVGKTTLMKQLQNNLVEKGKKTVFLDLDREKDNSFFDSQEKFLQRIKYEIGENKGYVFIDEI